MFSLTLLFICCLKFIDSAQLRTFVEVSTTTARGAVGGSIKIPCGVSPHGYDYKVSWKKIPYEAQEASINRIAYNAIRSPEFDSFVLHFEALEKQDEGVYTCFVSDLNGDKTKTITKNFTLTVLDSIEGLKWDLSRYCGVIHPILGQPGECDPEGLYPCCTSYGRCDYGELYCECSTCIDYRMENLVPSFDKRSPSVARAMIGKNAVIPCAVRNLFSDVDDEGNPLTVVKFNRTIKQDGNYETRSIVNDDKFDISFDPPFTAYNLVVKNVTKEDELTYHCYFTYQDKLHTKDIELTILDTEESIIWSHSGDCGESLVYRPRRSEIDTYIQQPCDRLGAKPCCRGKRCGFFAEDCLCPHCVDSRKKDVTDVCEELGMFKCSNRECANYNSQCDGKVDCSNGLDEQNCEMEETFENEETSIIAERHKSYSLPCRVSNLQSDSKVFWQTVANDRSLDKTLNMLMKENTSFLYFPKIDDIHSANYSCVIRNSRGAVKRKNFEVRVCDIENPAICKEDNKCIPKSQLCDGILNCKFGSDEENCPDTGYKALTTLSKAPTNQCQNPEECTTPFSLVGDKCVLASTSQMDWFEAQTFCRENLSEFITFNSIENIIPFLRTGNYPETLISKFPAWTGVYGDMFWTDRNGLKIPGLFSSGSTRSCTYLTSVKNISLAQTENCNGKMFALCEKSS